jgi:hypothetical protein
MKVLTVRGVHIHHANAHDFERDDAPLLVFAFFRKPEADRARLILARDGDPAVAAVAVGVHIVAEVSELVDRELLVRDLGFLQAHDVGVARLHPVEDLIEPGPDRVHVPGDDLHGGAQLRQMNHAAKITLAARRIPASLARRHEKACPSSTTGLSAEGRGLRSSNRIRSS